MIKVRLVNQDAAPRCLMRVIIGIERCHSPLEERSALLALRHFVEGVPQER